MKRRHEIHLSAVDVELSCERPAFESIHFSFRFHLCLIYLTSPCRFVSSKAQVRATRRKTNVDQYINLKIYSLYIHTEIQYPAQLLS